MLVKIVADKAENPKLENVTKTYLMKMIDSKAATGGSCHDFTSEASCVEKQCILMTKKQIHLSIHGSRLDGNWLKQCLRATKNL